MSEGGREVLYDVPRMDEIRLFVYLFVCFVLQRSCCTVGCSEHGIYLVST